jgi:hypothetical protein
VNLFDAPDIADSLFVGRESEIQQMEEILLPGSSSAQRKVVVLGGMGGIGKTQLSIAYAKRHRRSYTSVFWLNATSEVSLKGSLRKLAQRVLSLETLDRLKDDDQLCIEVSNWLSQSENYGWLLIYDNYDVPDDYELTKYYPSVAHGSIIVTTRVPSKVGRDKDIKVPSLGEERDSLRVLSTRSGREGIETGMLIRSRPSPSGD